MFFNISDNGVFNQKIMWPDEKRGARRGSGDILRA